MLDDYKNTKFYDYAINLKKYFHAYIFEVDDVNSSYPLILSFTKMLICKDHLSNNSNCSCNICHLIDENYYEDLKVIEPTGKLIKKEQILNLQKDLSLKSSNNTNQVYIIKEAEKMNDSASNSLLKFIEEPMEGIYAILITTNKNQLLETIISRCQLIELKSHKKINYTKEEISTNLDFLKLINTKKESAIAYLKKNYLTIYPTREDILKSFQILENILDKEINRRNEIIDDNFTYYDIIKENLQELSLNDLIFYLNKIVIFKDKLTEKPYLNINLFMDRFIIEVSKAVI